MKPTSRKPSPKATKCWAVVSTYGNVSPHAEEGGARFVAKFNGQSRVVPAWLLTQDQIPAVIEAMARAIGSDISYGLCSKAATLQQARAALRAAGVAVKK